jgi:exosortase
MDNPNYSHGPLIPLISLFVVYQKWRLLKVLEFTGWTKGLIVIMGAWLLYILSMRAQVNFLVSYSMIVMITGIVLYVLGRNAFSELAFPVLFLVFMVPFWVGAINKASNILKVISSMLTGQILNSLGYAVFREGVVLHLGNGSLEVADPCSGIRSLISLLALGCLMAYFASGGYIKKMILVLSVIPLTVIGNTLRVAFFGVVLETKGILISEGFAHTMTGFGVFALTFLALFLISKAIKI